MQTSTPLYIKILSIIFFLSWNHVSEAQLVITEIMYNTPSTDDEWIEICNIGSTPEIMDSMQIWSSTLEFTFSASTTLNAGDCITIAIGDNGTPPFNPGCPFNADYGSPGGTNNLPNSNGQISLRESDGTTIIDVVDYDDADGADGNDKSLHVIDATLDNAVTNSNWQEVDTGGSPGSNSLISLCAVTEIEFISTTSSISEDGGTIDVCVSIYAPSNT
ncbi:MAG: lamin tail domain-containing protein, partial [Bacteroidia bacterium]|nr:lamin tail domain-containing protein [Bacteroidia bacterium]